jgi:CRP-like cAMP-binding protein
MAELVGRMTPRRFEANRVIVRQGDAGGSMFVIRSGSVRISRRDAEGHETHLATLREGDYFGELSLITGNTRNATAVTLRECELLELTQGVLEEFMTKYPRFGAALRDYAEGRK